VVVAGSMSLVYRTARYVNRIFYSPLAGGAPSLSPSSGAGGATGLPPWKIAGPSLKPINSDV